MRLWSLHPSFLDTKGLLATWREALLAKHVLGGKTKGYVNHPQLVRFKETNLPLEYIDQYLFHIWVESQRRGYSFSREKFIERDQLPALIVTKGQLDFEWEHLKKKLHIRDLEKFKLLKDSTPMPHPLFQVIEGEISSWEKIAE